MIMQQPTSGPVPCDRIRPFTGLDQGFNAAVLQIASQLMPRGWSIGMPMDEPYTLADLKADVAHGGKIIIDPSHSDHTIFGDPEVNYAFRAWHDWCHLHGNHEFNMSGEYEVSRMQADHLCTLFGYEAFLDWWPLINAEVNGQARHAAETGQFPTDQMAFDLAYIRRVHPRSIYAKETR